MWDPSAYTIAAAVFLKLLGLIYVIIFGSFLFQIKGLLGKKGILPIGSYLDYAQTIWKEKRFRYLPTLFWVCREDWFLLAVPLLGVVFGLMLTCGIYQPLMLLFIYLLYLSIVNVGQDFLSFGWDVFILEITANAFLLSFTTVPNSIVWISLNFLLFRFHLQAGAVKLQSGDRHWRDLTALAYHYQTQPLPNTIAWYAYQLPIRFHQISAAGMFAIELVVAWGVFGTEDIRFITCICFIGLQYSIWLTGNFAYLNHLTAVFSVILIGNSYLEPFLGSMPNSNPASIWLEIPLTIAAAGLLFLQVVCVINHFWPNQTFMRILSNVAPLHLSNRYGIFAIMTTKRYEIVVEGSEEGINWKEYMFRFKPTKLTHRPRRVSPYHPRLDWQMWFLPFGYYEEEIWFQNFLYRLLEAEPTVLKLLQENPFPHKPPKYVRALAYDYVFADKDVKDFWWKRELIGAYSPTLSLKT